MLYVTGDTHGELDRFQSFKPKRPLFSKRKDVLIVCGDFGFLWDGGEAERKKLRWLSKRPYAVLFVEGTHDNLDLIRRFDPEPFCGGRARKVAENVWCLCRGEIFEIDGVRVFAMGGGETRDPDGREEGVGWWKEELPSPEELFRARDNLRRAGDTVDVIVTHESPARVGLLGGAAAEEPNALDLFLDEVSRKVQYKRWYFGALHLDKPVTSKLTAVFRQIHPVSFPLDET